MNDNRKTKKDAFTELRKPDSTTKKNESSISQKDSIRKIAEQSGFTQRSKKDKKDVYTQQIGFRCRSGMSRIIKGLTYKMDVKKQEIFELAILSLLKERGLTELINEYSEILEKEPE